MRLEGPEEDRERPSGFLRLPEEMAAEPVWVALPAEPRETPEVRTAGAVSRPGSRPAKGESTRPGSQPAKGESTRPDSRPGTPQTWSPATGTTVLSGKDLSSPAAATSRSRHRRLPPALSRDLQARLEDSSRGVLARRAASRRIAEAERTLRGVAGLPVTERQAPGAVSRRTGVASRLSATFPAGFLEVLRFPAGHGPETFRSAQRLGATATTTEIPWNLVTVPAIEASPPEGALPGSSSTLRNREWLIGDEAVLPVLPNSSRLEDLPGTRTRSGASSLAGEDAEALAPLVRTLFRSLRAMPQVTATAGSPTESGAPRDLVAWIASAAAASRAPEETPRLPEAIRAPWNEGPRAAAEFVHASGGQPDLREPPTLPGGTLRDRGEPSIPVRAEPGRSRLPGLPEGPTETDSAPLVEVSFGASLDLGSPRASGPLGLPSALSGETSGLPAPTYHGTLPLISAGVSAVSAAALASRHRPGEGRSSETQEPASRKAQEETAKGQASLDLEGLAAEMTQRILRRLKREKERRGFHA